MRRHWLCGAIAILGCTTLAACAPYNYGYGRAYYGYDPYGYPPIGYSPYGAYPPPPPPGYNPNGA